ncbi:YibE/F family protein [Georgenia sp. EYE_87]|uniref:YibE/F family protein n=1 Tax=Georgenia sp. EYE_87 TaxID=2853448 RepID=UPI002004F443|nr:YibE/F family protein [Georgenia sp. EYE_87]MCK6209416.1 YibE/F family protein [Georgenia sp. EYE_87]
MPHSHSHLPAGAQNATLAPAEARRARWILTALVVPLLVATVVALLVMWPRGETPIGSVPLAGTGMTIEAGSVVEVVDAAAPGATTDGQVRVELSTGDNAGQVAPVQVPPEIMANGMEVGDRVRLMFSPSAMGTGSPYVFWDFERTAPVGWLALLYAVVVLAVARWRGLAAMVGLAGSLGVIVVFVIPAIMLGQPPLLVALVGAAAMMFLSLYLAHGISIRTTTALLGTFVGLGITVALAAWGTRSANLTGTSSEQSLILLGTFPNLSLTDLLLCGMVIAGLGALNDVTITQASAVWELHAANPAVPRRRLFTRGMRIGRDHIASTVYTLAFAYVGTALPVLMTAALMDRAALDTLMAGEIAEEVVRTLVSSIGLVLAIPVTTGIAAALVRTSRPGRASRTDDDDPGRSRDVTAAAAR